MQNKICAYALTPGPKGVSQDQKLAKHFEIINNFNKGKRLGDYSRAHRHEPGAKSRRNIEIEILA